MMERDNLDCHIPIRPREAWNSLGDSACILEELIDFKCEMSVIGARSRQGEIICFDPGENIHRDGILQTTTVPTKNVSNVQREEGDLCG